MAFDAKNMFPRTRHGRMEPGLARQGTEDGRVGVHVVFCLSQKNGDAMIILVISKCLREENETSSAGFEQSLATTSG